MSIDKKIVSHIAKLARLAISEQELEQYAIDLNKILALADELKQIDTENISPLAHPLDMKQRLRDDVVTETDQHQLFQSIAPAVEAGLYLVPKVIDE
jgi:aspartyl-tRNA(Asn)/glutamyl-tRNA(Gln) amidotransferase subunit C